MDQGTSPQFQTYQAAGQVPANCRSPEGIQLRAVNAVRKQSEGHLLLHSSQKESWELAQPSLGQSQLARTKYPGLYGHLFTKKAAQQ